MNIENNDDSLEEGLITVEGTVKEINANEDEIKKPSATLKFVSILLLFLVGIAIGSTGKTVYDNANKANIQTIVEAASIVEKADLTQDPCLNFYDYSCGTYNENHLKEDGSSSFGDWQKKPLAKAAKIFDDAFNDSRNNLKHAAFYFYKACLENNENQSLQTWTLTGKDDSWAPQILKIGITLKGISVERTASPFMKGRRDVAIVEESYLSSSTSAPVVITQETDNCNYVELFNKILCAKTTFPECEDPTILLYGDSKKICKTVTELTTTNTSLVAQKALAEFKKNVVGKDPLTCFLRTSKYYTLPSQLYADETNASQIEKANLIFKEIKHNLAERADHVLGSKVASKIKKVSLHAGFSSQNLPNGPPKALIDKYSGNFADLVVAAQEWVTNEDITTRFTPVPAWGIDSFVINAYYSSAEVAIYLPDGIIQAMTADLDAISYGQLGWVMAHELAHSIDPSAINYNERGEYIEKIGMLPDGTKRRAYDRFVACISTGRPKQITEDFADIVGANIIEDLSGGTEELSSGKWGGADVSFSMKQLRVMAMAQVWCSTTPRNESAPENEDSHSHPKTRVELALTPMTDVFGCSVQPKCSL